MREGLHKILPDDDTIVAISTTPGHSAVGVVRISGRDSTGIAQLRFKSTSSNPVFDHRVVAVGRWNDSEGNAIDEVVLTCFHAPRSYTGEHVVEISSHGNPFVLRRIVESILEAGARLAGPGEFTLRAVAHGKMDLVQAEAVRDFIAVQTGQQAKTALRQMEGSLSKHLRPIKDALVSIIAQLEAGIDFAEDDVDVPANAAIATAVQRPRGQLEILKESYAYGRIVGTGLRLAILGKANVGKSSLFNKLLCSDRAIVTELPGTTRDVLIETLNIDGVPIRLADTAGIRDTTDVVESIGINRTLETLSEVDFAFVVVDGSSALDEDDRRAIEKVKDVPHLVVINKKDLPQVFDCARLDGATRVSVSALTGEGIEGLWEALRAFLLSCKTDLADDLVLTNVRQYEAIAGAAAALKSAEAGIVKGVPHEMVLLDLYRSLCVLQELTGEVVTDDILDRIFATFCVGK
jgi:tRNA modification GTPase